MFVCVCVCAYVHGCDHLNIIAISSNLTSALAATFAHLVRVSMAGGAVINTEQEVPFSECVYFVKICPVFVGPVTITHKLLNLFLVIKD